MPRLTGIYCPNIVPFRSDGSIHEEELRRIVSWLIDKGIDGLYPNGSTGEFARLSFEERLRVVEIVASENRGRVPILAGAAENSIDLVIQAARRYADLGVRAISVTGPYFFKVSPEGVEAYFYRDYKAGNYDECRRAQFKVLELIEAMLRAGNFPEGFRAGAALRGFQPGPSRQPAGENEKQFLGEMQARMACLLADCGFAEAAAQCRRSAGSDVNAMLDRLRRRLIPHNPTLNPEVIREMNICPHKMDSQGCGVAFLFLIIIHSVAELS